MSNGGKGSTPRPYSVDLKTFDNNWEAIFRKDKHKQQSSEESQDSEQEKDSRTDKEMGS